MKKFKTLSVIILGMLATVMLGACSCSKSTVSVLRITTDVEQVQAIEGEVFEVSYEIMPKEASNTKVSVSSSNSEIVRVNGASAIVGQVGKCSFVAESVGTAKVTFTTDDGGYKAEVSVLVVPDPDPLDKPTDLKYDQATARLTWSHVEGAIGYYVNINGTDYMASSNFYDGTEQGQLPLETDTEYTIKVRTHGDKYNGKDSVDYCDPIIVRLLGTPNNIVSNNGVVGWGSVDEATNYVITINGNEQVQTGTTIDLKNFASLLTTNNTFEYTISAYSTYNNPAGGYYVVPSASSTLRTITWLKKPTNTTYRNYDASVQQSMDSVASWNAVSSAVSYDIVIDGGDATNVTTTSYTIPTSLTAGAHNLTIIALGDPATTISGADYSADTFLVNKLPSLRTVVSGNILSVDYTPMTQTFGINETQAKEFIYELYFSIENSLISVVRLEGTLEYDLSTAQDIAEGGSYRVNVRAIAPNDTNYINGIYTTTPENTPFAKLQYTSVSAISRTGVITLNTVRGASQFEVHVDDQVVVVPATHSQVTVGDNTTIDINFDTISMSALTAGAHTVRVQPKGTGMVDATPSKCATFNFTKLTSSVNYSLDNTTGKVTWESVTNNAGYDLTFNGELISGLTNNYYIPSTTKLLSNNTFSVVALGNNRNIVNSDAYTFEIARVQAVTGIKIEDGTLRWDNNSNKYHVTVYYGGNDDQAITYTTTNNYYELASAGNYDVTIYQSADGMFNSAPSARYHINQLSRTTGIELDKTGAPAITFNSVINASAYQVDITRNGTPLISTQIDSNRYELPSAIAEGTYAVSIIAKGDALNNLDSNDDYNAYVDSKASDSYTFVKLATPANITKNGRLTWSVSTTNAQVGYFVVGIDGLNDQTFTASSNNGNWDMATYNNGTADVQLPSGTYNLTIQALARTDSAGANVLDSDVASVTNVTKVGTVAPYVNAGSIQFANVVGASNYVVEYSQDGTLWTTGGGKVTTENMGSYTTIKLSNLSSGYLRVLSRASNGYISSGYSSTIQFSQLPNVTNFTKLGTTLSWTQVPNSTGYYLSNNKGTYVKDVTQASATTDTITNPTTSGSYIYSIYAKGSQYDVATTQSSVVYLQSDSTELEVVVLQQVAGVKLDSGILSWNKYTSVTTKDIPTKLLLTISGDASFTREIVNMEQTTFDLNSVVDDSGNALNAGSYTITMQYVGNGNDILSGASYTFVNSDTTTNIVKVDTPTVTVEQGGIVWDKVNGLDNYTLQLKEKSGTNNYVTLSSSQYTLSVEGNKVYANINVLKENTEYLLQVRTVANAHQLSSNYSDELTICKLGVVQNFAVDSTNFVWEAIPTSQTYDIVNVTTTEVIVDNSTNGTHSATEQALRPGTYEFKIKANGTTAYAGSGVAYLSGEYTSTIKVVYVDHVESIALNNNVLTWQSVAGISDYDVQLIKGTDVVRNRIVGTNSCSLEFFDSDLTGGTYNTFSVRCVSTVSDMYIIANYDASDDLTIYKAPKLTEVRIENGMVAWDIDKTALVEYYKTEMGITTMTDAHYRNLSQLMNDLLSGVTTTGNNVEIFRPFYTFTLMINGQQIDITPKSHNPLTSFTFSASRTGIDQASFYYAIDEDVTKFTTYNIQVRSQGNSSDSTTITKVLASTYSSVLSAIKTPSPKTTVLHNGYIKFALITKTTGEGSTATTSYVDKYVITAIPQATSGGALGSKKTRIITVPVDPISPDYEYSYYLMTEDEKGETLLTRNVKYSIVLTSLGTEDSRTAEGDVYFLRSTNYNNQIITFFDKVQGTKYISTDQNVGGMMLWTPIVGTKQNAYVIDAEYATTKDTFDGTLNEWLATGEQEGKVYVFSVETGVGNFAFNTIVQDLAIPAGDYVFGVKAIGDTRSTIESEQMDLLPFTKLAPTTISGSSWVNSGVFTWTAVENCNQYKVVLMETTSSGDTITHDATIVNTNSYDIPVGVGAADSTFALIVTPLGTTIDGINYVSGYEDTTDAYNRLATPEITFSVDANNMSWQAITGSAQYEVQLNGTVIPTTDTSYVFNGLVAGKYPVTVRALSGTNSDLHGVFADLKTIVKLNDAVLQVKTTSTEAPYELHAGYISWEAGREDDTLIAGKVKLDIHSANASHVSGDLIKTVTLDSTVKTYDISLLPQGYYDITVTFVNDDNNEGEFTLPSNPVTMLVYKQAAPTPLNGTYYPPEIIDQKETSFDGNYLEWNLVSVDGHTEYNYYVQMYAVTDGVQSATPTYQFDTINHATYFETYPSTNPTKIFFDISWLNLDRTNIYVACMGDISSNTTITNPNVIGYTCSSQGYTTIEIPTQAPVISSSNSELARGIIKWDNVYNADIEVVLTFDYNQYDSTTQNVTTIEDKEHREVLKAVGGVGAQEYHLPYVSSNYVVKIRYVLANYVSVYSDPVNASMTMFAYGAGTEADPYLMMSASTDGVDYNMQLTNQLIAIQNYPNAYYELLNDFTIITDNGKFDELNCTFNGNFDGNGHKISGINMASTDQVTTLFSSIGASGKVHDVTLSYATNINRTALGDVTRYTFAPLANTNYGNIYNVNVEGSVSVNLTNGQLIYGGLVATNYGTISNVNSNLSSTLVSSADVSLGGLSSTNYGTISASTVGGALSASSTSNIVASVGGIANTNSISGDYMGVISGCTVTGSISSNSMGGIAYRNASTIEGCGFTGAISATDANRYTIIVGGVVGRNEGGNVSFSYSVLTGSTLNLAINSVSSSSSVGGLIGYGTNGTYNNCYTEFSYSLDSVSSSLYAGSVCGQLSSSGINTFENVYYISTTNPSGLSNTIDGVSKWEDRNTLPTDLNNGSTTYQFVVDGVTAPYAITTK